MNEDFAETVLSVVDLIPAGRVMSYGQIAEYLQSGGPRQVGAVMASHGAAVAWWRVIHADGTLDRRLRVRAGEQYAQEGTALRPGDEVRVDMSLARWWPEDEG